MTRAALSVLVTGPTGFLGGFVARRWQDDPCMANLYLASRRPVASAGEWVELDLSKSVRLPGGIDVVVHVAGEKRDESRMREVNELGTRRLAEAAAAAGVRRFVYVSSVGSYGAPAHSGAITESFPHTPRNLYEASKDAGETSVRSICASAGMQAVILQPSNVIGRVPGKTAPLLGLMRTVARGRFAWFGRTDPIVNYVAVDDVAAALVAASRQAVPGTYIVNTPCRLVDLVGWVADELRIATPARRLPGWLGSGLALAGGAAAALTGRSMPFGPERLLELTNTNRYAPEALMKATGFSYPTSIEKLVRELARGYISEGLI